MSIRPAASAGRRTMRWSVPPQQAGLTSLCRDQHDVAHSNGVHLVCRAVCKGASLHTHKSSECPRWPCQVVEGARPRHRRGCWLRSLPTVTAPLSSFRNSTPSNPSSLLSFTFETLSMSIYGSAWPKLAASCAQPADAPCSDIACTMSPTRRFCMCSGSSGRSDERCVNAKQCAPLSVPHAMQPHDATPQMHLSRSLEADLARRDPKWMHAVVHTSIAVCKY